MNQLIDPSIVEDASPETWRDVASREDVMQLMVKGLMLQHVAAVRETRSALPVETKEYLAAMLETAILPNHLKAVSWIHAHAESEIERYLLQLLFLLGLRESPIGLMILEPSDDGPGSMDQRIEAGTTARYLDRKIPGWRHRDVPEEFEYTATYVKVCSMFSSGLLVMPQAGMPASVVGSNMRVDTLVASPIRSRFKVVVECDGYRWHGNKESFTADRQRDRALADAGYRVLRFSGSEIWNDPLGTAMLLLRQLRSLMEAVRPDRQPIEPKYDSFPAKKRRVVGRLEAK